MKQRFPCQGFGAGCGRTCDVRAVTVASDAVVIEEQASNFTCPGACRSPAFPGGPFSATLTDVMVGGTGTFTGASGNLGGTVEGTGMQSQIQLSGSTTLANYRS